LKERKVCDMCYVFCRLWSSLYSMKYVDNIYGKIIFIYSTYVNWDIRVHTLSIYVYKHLKFQYLQLLLRHMIFKK
jgi:hypothetical protein